MHGRDGGESKSVQRVDRRLPTPLLARWEIRQDLKIASYFKS